MYLMQYNRYPTYPPPRRVIAGSGDGITFLFFFFSSAVPSGIPPTLLSMLTR